MQRNKELMERRNKAIYARFNELIKTGQQYIKIYEQLEDEFFISEETIKKIVLCKTKGIDDPLFEKVCSIFAADLRNASPLH